MSAAIPVSLLLAGLLVVAFIVEDTSILGKPSTDAATITSTVTQTVIPSNSTSTTLLSTCGLGAAFQCSAQGQNTTTSTPFLTVGGGTPVTESIQMQAFNFNVSPGSCVCSGDVLVISLINSGNSSTTIGAVYLDGVLQTVTRPPTADTALASAQVFLIPTGTNITSDVTGDIEFSSSTPQTAYTAGLTGQVVIAFAAGSAPTSGTGHTVKIVSATGATFVMTVVAGKTG